MLADFVQRTFAHRPFRFDDASLTTILHLSLILVYTSVLLIKTCEHSEEACEDFGFGKTADGAEAPHHSPPCVLGSIDIGVRLGVW